MELFSVIAFPVIVFHSILLLGGGLLGWLLYAYLKKFDENAALWTSIIAFLVVVLTGEFIWNIRTIREVSAGFTLLSRFELVELFRGLTFRVVFFSLLAGLGTGGLAFLHLKRFEENTAFWTSITVFLVVGLAGLFTMAYGAVFVLALTALLYFMPQLSRKSWIALLLVVGTVAVSYVGLPYTDNPKNPITKSAVANHFAYDDKDLLTGNDFLVGWMAGAPNLRGKRVEYWDEVIRRDFAQLAQKAAGAPGLNAINYYRPIIALSYMLDTYFWSDTPEWKEFAEQKEKNQRSELKWTTLNPVGFHLTNVLMHALNSILVFVLVRSLTRRFRVALAAGVLFAVHPIHTESVTWIAGRTDVIGMTFFLAAFWLYVRFRNSGRTTALVGAVMFALVAIFAKEMVATLGLALLVYEVVRHVARRRGAGDLYLPPRPTWLAQLAPLQGMLIKAGVAVALFTVAGFGSYMIVKGILFPAPPMEPPVQASPWFNPDTGQIFSTSRIFFSFMGAGFWYLGKALAPLHLNIYPWVDWVQPGKGIALLLAHLAIVGGAIALLLFWRRGRLLSFGILAFYVSLAPLSCVLPGMRLLRFSEDVDFPVSERFLYIPSLFIVLALAWVLGYWIPRLMGWWGRQAAGLLLVLLTAGGVYLDHRRAVDWYDDYHLFASGVRTSEQSVRMANNFGFELMQNWEIKRARKQLLRCTSLVSEIYKNRAPMPVAFQNLGHSYYLQGEFNRAMDYYRKSFQYDPKNAVAANNLGALMGIFGSITMNIELIKEGFEYYRRSVQLAPDYVFARASVNFMGRVYNTWEQYLFKKDRRPMTVASFGNSFLFAARSISESEDPRYLQSMMILDSGLRNMPSDEEMKIIFKDYLEKKPAKELEEADVDTPMENPHLTKQKMTELFDRCFTRGVAKYEKLLQEEAIKDPEHGASNPALNFLLGEVHRVGWRRTRSPEHRDRAIKAFEVTLSQEPDHGGATRGLVEMLRARGELDRAVELAARTAHALLEPELPWQESVPEPTVVRRTQLALGLVEQIVGQARGDLGTRTDDAAQKERAKWDQLIQNTARECLRVQEEMARTQKGGQDSELWNNLGYFYVLAYRIFQDPEMLEEAMKHLDHALQLDRYRPGPALNKIEVLMLMDKPMEAEQLRELMRRRFPRDPRFNPKSGIQGMPQKGPMPAAPFRMGPAPPPMEPENGEPGKKPDRARR